jgi:hypothetical protein
LAEALHHSHAGDGFLDMLGDVGRALLSRPGRRKQRAPGPGGDQPGSRHHDQRDQREQRGQPQHRAQRDGEQYQHTRCQGDY